MIAKDTTEKVNEVLMELHGKGVIIVFSGRQIKLRNIALVLKSVQLVAKHSKVRKCDPHVDHDLVVWHHVYGLAYLWMRAPLSYEKWCIPI